MEFVEVVVIQVQVSNTDKMVILVISMSFYKIPVCLHL